MSEAIKLSAHEAYRDWMMTKVNNAEKLVKARDEVEAIMKPHRERLARLERKLNADTEAKYHAFEQVMAGRSKADGIIRKRPDPTKKNSYEVAFKLAPTQLAKLASESDALNSIMKTSKPKVSPNQSLVKQYLASGRFVKSGDHLVDQETGELLDAYITASLKPDEFEEVQS